MSLATNIRDLAERTATQDKLLLTLLSGNVPNLTALATTDKSSIVAALNEVAAAVATASGIDDTETSTSSTWSSSRIAQAVTAAIDALTDSAPGTLDTLNELAAALGDDPNFAATITQALALRLRVDEAQNLTTAQQATARANIGAAAAGDVGDTTTDFVAVYNAALA